ncbi:hypothetical protein KDAU_50390 [Dictyobacter aurantiacus]|uniref:Uncharacterized protein n=1 Tax=Dictyobacter aurantiacus TaxID=1936993 RepID=A0A401ZLL0_9CHLR|nr:hypothetical protein KDAU_50390 [Dictyobacter aurantiacus]
MAYLAALDAVDAHGRALPTRVISHAVVMGSDGNGRHEKQVSYPVVLHASGLLLLIPMLYKC